MYIGQPTERDITEVGGISKTGWHVGSIGYKIEKKTERKS